jgi:2Fe-2S ferredoxin
MKHIIIKILDKERNLHELTTEVNPKKSLMHFMRENNLGINGSCDGIGECLDCHIYVNSNHELKEMSIIEEMMIDELDSKQNNSRLSCQLGLVESLDGLEVEIVNE